jgi:citrate lyase beta subunit
MSAPGPASRARRCLLFMPADSRAKIEKGIALGVDAIIMDLEDGVAFDRKAEARAGAAAALRELDFGRSERIVRINPISSALAQDDLAAVAPAHPDAIMIPKVERAEDVGAVSAALARIEADHGLLPGGIVLIALIETALGIVNLREIAASDARLVALAFGAEDLAGDLGALRTPSGHEVAYGQSAVVIHARAFGLSAIDTPHVQLDDDAGLAAAARRARELGYSGKLAIHPRQIDGINAAFTPTLGEIEAARRLIAAFEAQQAEGRGVFRYEGRMIDLPMIRAAQAILARARAAGLLG